MSHSNLQRRRNTPVRVATLLFIFCCIVVKESLAFKLLLLTPPLGGKGAHLPWMKTLAETLSLRGHKVTLLLQGHGKDESELFTTRQVPSCFSNEQNRKFLELYLQDSADFFRKMVTECEAILNNGRFLLELQAEKFDLAVTDRFYHCGYLIAETLELPFAVFDGASYMGPLDAQAPSPLAYVPMFNSRFTDRMTLRQRLKNVYIYFARQLVSKVRLFQFNHLIKKYSISRWETSIEGIMGKAQLWLLDSDFSLEFPRPLMPNMVYVGGLLITPVKPLAKELEDFMTSSGDKGMVILSLGTWLHGAMSLEHWNKIAAGLAMVPQKVIWKYTGLYPPARLGNNTKLVPWLPQNDLLGHPKTRVFVTHGGTNSVLEAIAHGKPMVVMPLCCDHIDHSVRVVAKGAGVSIDLRALEPEDLANAIHQVISNPSYKKAVGRLSRIQKDQPLPPRERVTFWIEHVIRNNGTHLRARSFELAFYQYFLLDVAVVLMAVSLSTFILVRRCVLALIRFGINRFRVGKCGTKVD